ncbi:hypothetical protein ZHAS_00018551 [Anopheles sinensis]|uniref:Uncharacterized protein n=1 Tax=Anopheles sinensis TaxID=74873 RepID=A0A084WJB5_ANOSI|nr:hypothetical protein ZHAS_00018551 [Anopheles sinensis]
MVALALWEMKNIPRGRRTRAEYETHRKEVPKANKLSIQLQVGHRFYDLRLGTKSTVLDTGDPIAEDSPGYDQREHTGFFVDFFR